MSLKRLFFKNPQKVLIQMAAASAASFSFMIMGCVRGWSSPAMPKLLESGYLNITEDQASWITKAMIPDIRALYQNSAPWVSTNSTITSFCASSDRNFRVYDAVSFNDPGVAWPWWKGKQVFLSKSSVPPLASIFGSLAAGPLLGILGRKWTLALISIPYSVGFLLVGFATHPTMMLVGRILSGLTIGVTTPSAQIYIGECSSPRVRGALGSFTAIFLALGILITYVIGKFVDWDELAWILSILPASLLVSMLFVPETPSFLLSKGKEEEARKSLQFYRGRNTNIEPEYEKLRANVMKASNSGNQGIKITDLKKGSVFKPLLLSMGLMFFQQFSGVNAVIYYTVKIFEASGSTIDKNDSTIIVGAVQLIATFGAMFLVDRAGRRILLLLSGSLMAISLSAMGAFFYIQMDQGEDAALAIGWLPLVSLIVFIVAYSLGFANVPFLIMGELFPAKYRGLLGSFASCFNLACTFTIVRTFDIMALSIGYYGAFWLYASCCALGIFFVFFLLPETKGKSFEDIERMFMNPKKRKALEAVTHSPVDEKRDSEKAYYNKGLESEDEDDDSQSVATVM